MKVYVVIYHDNYLKDNEAIFDTLEEAKAFIDSCPHHKPNVIEEHIINQIGTKTVVYRGE